MLLTTKISSHPVISVDVDGNYFINPMTSPGVDEIEDLEPVSLNVAINQILARKEILS